MLLNNVRPATLLLFKALIVRLWLRFNVKSVGTFFFGRPETKIVQCPPIVCKLLIYKYGRRVAVFVAGAVVAIWFNNMVASKSHSTKKFMQLTPCLHDNLLLLFHEIIIIVCFVERVAKKFNQLPNTRAVRSFARSPFIANAMWN